LHLLGKDSNKSQRRINKIKNCYKNKLFLIKQILIYFSLQRLRQFVRVFYIYDSYIRTRLYKFSGNSTSRLSRTKIWRKVQRGRLSACGFKKENKRKKKSEEGKKKDYRGASAWLA